MVRYSKKFYWRAARKDLAMGVVDLYFEQPLQVCMRNWESEDLSVVQIEFACINAFATFRIAEKLLKNPLGPYISNFVFFIFIVFLSAMVEFLNVHQNKYSR